MKITKKQLKQIIKEELEKVIAENVPNPDFMRRSHGGKTCEEWNQEISRLRAAYVAAQEEQLALDDAAQMYQTDDVSRAAMAYRETGDVKAAAEALSAAIHAAKRHKCPTN